MIRSLIKLIEKFVSLVAPRFSLFLKPSPHATRKVGWLVAFPLAILVNMPCPGMAQSAPPAEAAKSVQILLLGTAGGPPIRIERSEPSSLLIVDGREYLIDCGIGTIRRMVSAGIQSETIRTIFFTHLHPDHALGLADVMANDVFKTDLVGGRTTVNIYGPPQTPELVKAAVNYVGIPSGIFQAEGLPGSVHAVHFVAHKISKEGVVYQDDNIRVIAAENTHYTLIPPKFRARMKSYAYRFETPCGVIVFTGDTGPSDAVARLAKGADVLIPECQTRDRAHTVEFANAWGKRFHWSPERTRIFTEHMTQAHMNQQEVGELATKAQVKSVILHHFNPKDPAAAVANVKKYYSGPVFAGADLEWFRLSPGTGLKRILKGSSHATDKSN